MPPADHPSFLTLPVFHILVSLADRERHGYAILKEIERRTAGAVTLSTGTLYAAIKRLLADGLVERTAGRADPDVDDQRRIYYQLTPSGYALLQRETDRLAELVAASRKRLGRPGLASRGSSGGAR